VVSFILIKEYYKNLRCKSVEFSYNVGFKNVESDYNIKSNNNIYNINNNM
jgi:hypothetical protein